MRSEEVRGRCRRKGDTNTRKKKGCATRNSFQRLSVSASAVLLSLGVIPIVGVPIVGLRIRGFLIPGFQVESDTRSKGVESYRFSLAESG